MTCFDDDNPLVEVDHEAGRMWILHAVPLGRRGLRARVAVGIDMTEAKKGAVPDDAERTLRVDHLPSGRAHGAMPATASPFAEWMSHEANAVLVLARFIKDRRITRVEPGHDADALPLALASLRLVRLIKRVEASLMRRRLERRRKMLYEAYEDAERARAMSFQGVLRKEPANNAHLVARFYKACLQRNR